MVCLSSRGPNSDKLLRYGSRLAGKLNRNWYAVYVQTPSEEATVIDAQVQRLLSDTLTLAKQLGAMVFTYKGEDIADTILRFAGEYRVGPYRRGQGLPEAPLEEDRPEQEDRRRSDRGRQASPSSSSIRARPRRERSVLARDPGGGRPSRRPADRAPRRPTGLASAS